MPRATNFPDPNGATTIGASLRVSRVAVGAAGVEIIYNPGNGDSPLETTITAGLDAAGRTALNTVITQLDAAYKVAKGYT